MGQSYSALQRPLPPISEVEGGPLYDQGDVGSSASAIEPPQVSGASTSGLQPDIPEEYLTTQNRASRSNDHAGADVYEL